MYVMKNNHSVRLNVVFVLFFFGKYLFLLIYLSIFQNWDVCSSASMVVAALGDKVTLFHRYMP